MKQVDEKLYLIEHVDLPRYRVAYHIAETLGMTGLGQSGKAAWF